MPCRWLILIPLILIGEAERTAVGPAELRILLLSKYHLREINIIAESPELHLSDERIAPPGAVLRVARTPGGMSIEFTGGRRGADFVSISSSGLISISFLAEGRPQIRRYSGSLEIRPAGEELAIVNVAPLEDYVHAAARAELGDLLSGDEASAPGWKRELLASMEVAVRSYVLSGDGRHRGEGCALCDLTHCVYFAGINEKDREILTRGEVMLDESGKILCAYFHSCCGGMLGGPESYWIGARAGKYFRRGEDSFKTGEILCAGSPHFRWSARVSEADMRAILGAKSVHELRPEHSDGRPAGDLRRVSRLAFIDERGVARSVPVSRFLSDAGRRLGWNVVKSGLFGLERSGGGYLLKGAGLGHGVGMCQHGARECARRGMRHRDILKFYYNDPRFEVTGL